MLRLHCPYCASLRDEEEFTYGGPLERVRPADPSQLDDAAWAAWLFERDNPRGLAHERWRHTFGCRKWFGVERDTVTHVVRRTAPLDACARHPEALLPTYTRGADEAA
ncbi:sarcosine oxidase subunit delta [Paraburkholderia sp. J63]|uniref:sarcosine oxidase subunit delta n=1 Tax=Paraburkholderia sp. J63 TaxID=2805434 RepID=UPI002ABE2B98|nr:sarcosine oxidase subunit delta [Paraburkholderia sp. J63]